MSTRYDMKIFSIQKAGTLLLAMILAVSFSGVSFAAEPGPGAPGNAQEIRKDNGPGKTYMRSDSRYRPPSQATKQDRNDNRDRKPGLDKKDKDSNKGKPYGKNGKKHDNDKLDKKRDGNKRDHNGKKRDDNTRPGDKKGGQDKKRDGDERDNGKKRGGRPGKNGDDRR